MAEKLKKFILLLQERKINFSSLDFREFLKKQNFKTRDFVFLDSPYLISTATYNENGGWSKNDEQDLLEQLDRQGIKFALSKKQNKKKYIFLRMYFYFTLFN